MSGGDRQRLTISRCHVNKGLISVREGDADRFDAMLNPTDFSHGRSIHYNKTPTLGQLGSDQKFGAIRPETLSFKVLLDGTGAVRYPGSKDKPVSVKDLLEKLHKITYDYVGEQHEPSVVQVLWGDLIFYGRLTGQKVDHTLFNAGGASLRAWAVLSFESYISNEEEAKKANKSSPDLSHRVTFREGDTLPLLCYRIYRDAAYYDQVARVNHIVNFRRIRPGTQVWFPPLK